MARRVTTYTAASNRYTIEAGANETILGVELKESIPQGYDSAGAPEGDVKIRPTNVTATISTVGAASIAAATQEPNYILLKNGPQGGFSQSARLENTMVYQVNAVVAAVITDA